MNRKSFDEMIDSISHWAAQGLQVRRKDKDQMSDTGGSSKGRGREPHLKPPRDDLKKRYKKKRKKPENQDKDTDNDKDLKKESSITARQELYHFSNYSSRPSVKRTRLIPATPQGVFAYFNKKKNFATDRKFLYVLQNKSKRTLDNPKSKYLVDLMNDYEMDSEEFTKQLRKDGYDSVVWYGDSHGKQMIFLTDKAFKVLRREETHGQYGGDWE